MFTIKLYRGNFVRIFEAGSFSVHADGSPGGRHEITLHDVPGRDDFRVDLVDDDEPPDSPVRYFDSAIIENTNGKTTQMFSAIPSGHLPRGRSGETDAPKQAA